MGVFSIQIKVRNWQNQFLPPEARGEDITCDAVVDSGASELALPAELLDRLKLEEIGRIRARTADGQRHNYPVFGIAELEVQGRVCQVRAIRLPHGAQALLGAVALEEMDWHISPSGQKLLPNPDSPNEPLLSI
jgi:clan AA aspartic protease